jgi:hypothetical protein
MNSKISISFEMLAQETGAPRQASPNVTDSEKEPDAAERLKLFEEQRRGSGQVRPAAPLLRWLEEQKA